MTNTFNGALVVGVTGMAGVSLVEALKRPNAPGGPWKVYGVARRPPPAWFPSSTLDRFIELDSLDSILTVQTLSPLAPSITHVFWVPLVHHPDEVLNISENSAMFKNVLNALTTSSEAGHRSLRHVTVQTGTKHYVGPIMDPELLLEPLELPFKENVARQPLPNFYYALEDLVEEYRDKGLIEKWSVHRASCILGASTRSVYNFLIMLATYALICRKERMEFIFPGTRAMWEGYCDAVDADLLAEQHLWAATTDAAKNQAFNCADGDVFTWRSVWRLFSELFGVKFVEYDDSIDRSCWLQMMKSKGPVWDAIVEENGLYKTKLEEIARYEAMYMVTNFKFQHVCSMNKSKEYGFMGWTDTLKSIAKWIERLRKMNILPRA